jgi:hypothetical protein
MTEKGGNRKRAIYSRIRSTKLWIFTARTPHGYQVKGELETIEGTEETRVMSEMLRSDRLTADGREKRKEKETM